MKSLIIGGTGFIGSNLVRKLVNDGEEVGLLVRKQSKTWRIKDLLTQIVNDKYSVGAFSGMIFNMYISHPDNTIPELIKQALVVRLVALRMAK